MWKTNGIVGDGKKKSWPTAVQKLAGADSIGIQSRGSLVGNSTAPAAKVESKAV